MQAVGVTSFVTVLWFELNSNYVRSWPMTQNVDIVVHIFVWHGECVSICQIRKFYYIICTDRVFDHICCSMLRYFCAFIIYSEEMNCLRYHQHTLTS